MELGPWSPMVVVSWRRRKVAGRLGLPENKKGKGKGKRRKKPLKAIVCAADGYEVHAKSVHLPFGSSH